jgi:hypothetical protein
MNQEDLVAKFGEMKVMIKYHLLLMIMITMVFLENGLTLEHGLHLGILL